MLTRFLAGAAAVLAVLTVAPAASARAASPGPPASGLVNTLRKAYLAALPNARPGRISGIVYPRGMQPAAVQGACNSRGCALVYHGGPVQHHPRVYLLLWGPKWRHSSSEKTTAAYLKRFFRALGRQPRDHWSRIMSQFGTRSGYPGFHRSVFRGAWYDTSRPPRHTTQRQFAAEANAFARRHHIRNRTDAQVVIATQSGTCPQGFYAPSVCGGNGYYCGYHSTSRIPYVNLPYLLDAGVPCGENAVRSPRDGFSIVGGHEYAETVTDPIPLRGWVDRRDPSGGEIGDKCAWHDPGSTQPNSGTVRLSTGTFAVQPLFSNIARARTGDGCVLSGAPGGRVTGLRHKCLGVPGSASGTTVRLSGCAGGVGQFWTRGSNGRSLHVYGECLTDPNAGGKGTKVVMAACTGSAGQRWSHLRNGELRLRARNLCLTDPGNSTRSGVKLVVAACKDRRGQRWKLPFKL